MSSCFLIALLKISRLSTILDYTNQLTDMEVDARDTEVESGKHWS